MKICHTKNGINKHPRPEHAETKFLVRITTFVVGVTIVPSHSCFAQMNLCRNFLV